MDLASYASVASSVKFNNVIEPDKDKRFQGDLNFPLFIFETSFLKNNFRYSKQMLKWSTEKMLLCLKVKIVHPYSFKQQLEYTHIYSQSL